VHGTIARWRCSRHGCQHGAPWGSLPLEAFDALRWFDDPREEMLPRCPSCRSLVRAHVLLFDEYYAEHDDYGFPRATSAFESMELLLLVGTSLSVGITDIAVHAAASKRIPAIRIDPPAETNGFTLLLKGEAERVLPEMLRAVTARPRSLPDPPIQTLNWNPTQTGCPGGRRGGGGASTGSGRGGGRSGSWSSAPARPASRPPECLPSAGTR